MTSSAIASRSSRLAWAAIIRRACRLVFPRPAPAGGRSCTSSLAVDDQYSVHETSCSGDSTSSGTTMITVGVSSGPPPASLTAHSRIRGCRIASRAPAHFVVREHDFAHCCLRSSAPSRSMTSGRRMLHADLASAGWPGHDFTGDDVGVDDAAHRGRRKVVGDGGLAACDAAGQADAQLAIVAEFLSDGSCRNASHLATA